MASASIHPFPYDPFQERAIEIIDRDCSLFVAAPTGSGKTVLADYVIDRTLARHQRVIYTAPIKALSNQKFRDFTARYGEQVGILTGDVTINPHAPLVIMTTEIYRNTLLEDPERVSAYHWIIFDEIHYLDDPERGTVWEEAILFSPPHIKLLALSATIPNVQELAQWIRTVHQRTVEPPGQARGTELHLPGGATSRTPEQVRGSYCGVEVIEETKRPVPLTILFQCQNRIVTTLNDLKQEGFRGVEQWPRVRHHQGNPHRWAVHANRVDRLVRELQDRERLPCILFTFGRRRAEELAWEIAAEPLVSPEERAGLRRLFETLCAQFQLTHDRSLEPLRHLIDRGVGYHHAGMLPLVKEVVERCFTSRLMKLIVTTETFALGINMPARSVVLDALQKRSDSGFELLRRRDVLQMAGRAGRRGMDEAGFVYLRVNPRHVTYPEVVRLLHATPEPVQSRFNTSYATLLNLYRRHGRALLDVFPRTLYYAQTHGARRAMGLDLMQRKLDLLESMGYLTRTSLTPKGEFGAWVYGYELLLTELYSERRLAELDALALAILVVAIVYEPRPRMGPPKSHRVSKRMSELCREPLARIHKEETHFRITTKTKGPAFHLSHAMDAWMARAPFEQLTKLCDVDEGEIVRYFRMAVQLLRELSESPAAEAQLQAHAAKAAERINRDVIDAEAQLRLG